MCEVMAPSMNSLAPDIKRLARLGDLLGGANAAGRNALNDVGAHLVWERPPHVGVDRARVAVALTFSGWSGGTGDRQSLLF